MKSDIRSPGSGLTARISGKVLRMALDGSIAAGNPRSSDRGVALNDGGTRRLSGERLFLNSGIKANVPCVPSVPDFAEAQPLELDRVPDHLIVLGGGHVGLEFAHPFRRFGSLVTIVERGDRLASRGGPD